MLRKAGKKMLGLFLVLSILVCWSFVQMPSVQAASSSVTSDGIFVAPTSNDWVDLNFMGYSFGSGKHTGQFTVEYDLSILTGTPTGNIVLGAYACNMGARPIDVALEGRPADGNYKTLLAGGARIPYATGDQFHFTFTVNITTQKYDVVVTKGGSQVINRTAVGYANGVTAANIGTIGVRDHCNGTFAVKNLKVDGTTENLLNATDDVNNPPAIVRPSGTVFEVGVGKAFRKIQDVLSLLEPGDTVLVYPGTYPGGISLPPQMSGTATQPITIKGIRDAFGNRPIIKGVASYNIIEAQASNIVIQGLDITGNMYDLMADTGTTYSQLKNGEVNNGKVWWNSRITQRGIFQRDNNLTIRDCAIHGTGTGILSADKSSGSITIEYNEIYDNGSGNGAHQLYLTTDQLECPNAVARIQFNYIHDELGSGANIKTRCTRNEIYYNRVEDAVSLAMELTGPDGEAVKEMERGYDIEVNSYREDSDVVGNLIIEHDSSWGVRMGGDKDMAQTYGRYRFLNNTFVMGGGAPLRVEVGTVESIELYNNIFDTTVPAELARIRDPEAYWSAWSNGVENFAGSRNWISNKYSTIPAQLTNTIFGDAPGFNNPTTGDYTLRNDISMPGVALDQTQHTFDFWTANGGQGHQINGYEQYAYLTCIDTAFPNPKMDLYYTAVNEDLSYGCRADALNSNSTPTIGAYPAMMPKEDIVNGKVTHKVTMLTPDNGAIGSEASKAGEGNDVNITAVANSGYYFTGWILVSGEGASISNLKSANAKLAMGTGDVILNATFAQSGGNETEKNYIFDGTLNNIRPFGYYNTQNLPASRYLVKSLDGTVTMTYEGDYWAGYNGPTKIFQAYHANGTAEDALAWSRVGGYNGPVPFDEGTNKAGMKFSIRATGASDATLFNIPFIHGANTVGLTNATLVFNAKLTSNMPDNTAFMLKGTNKDTTPQLRPVKSDVFTTDHVFWMYNNASTADLALPDMSYLMAMTWGGDYSGMTMDISEIYFAGPGNTPIRSTLTLTQPTGGTINVTNPSGDGKYAPGEVVNVTAAELSGYTFAGWQTLGGGSFGDTLSTTTTFTMPNGAAAITAAYVQQGNEPLEKLTLDYSAVNRAYTIGSTLNISGLLVNAKYTGVTNLTPVSSNNCSYSVNDGASMNYSAINGYALQGPIGDYKITVSYQGKTVSFYIRVGDPAVLNGIILSSPYRTTYTVNSPLDLGGLMVTGVYSDGSSRAFASNEYTLKIFINGTGSGTTITDGAELTQYGTHRIDATAGGFTRSFNITVSAVQNNIEITHLPNKLIYAENEKFDTTGMVVTAHLSDGTSRPLSSTEYIITPANASGLNQVPDGESSATQTVTVTSAGATVNFNITVTPEVVGIYAAPNKQFNVGDTVTKADIDVTVIYRNDTFATLSPTDFTISANSLLFIRTGNKAVLVSYSGKTAYTVARAGQQVGPVITIGSYNTNPTNQNITVTASVTGGTLNATTHTFTENGSFEFVATDGTNVTRKTVTITNIDKVAPVITIGSYDTNPTTQPVTVTASTNEGSLNTTTHTFTENGSFDFVATDAAGNITATTVTISNITTSVDKRYIFDGTLNNVRPFKYWGDQYLPESRYLVKSLDGTVTMAYNGENWVGTNAQGTALFQLHHATGTAEDAVTWSRLNSYTGPVPFDEGANKAQMKFSVRATGSTNATLFDLPFLHGVDTTGIASPKLVFNAKFASNMSPDTTLMLTGTNKGTDPQFRPVASTTFTTAHMFWMWDNKSTAGIALPDFGTLTAMNWAGDYSGLTIDISEIYFTAN